MFFRGVESFFCEECGQGFQLRASLQKHLVNRHENEPKIHICDVGDCKVSFKKRIYLTNHKINYHKIERKYLCQVSVLYVINLSNRFKPINCGYGKLVLIVFYVFGDKKCTLT